MAVPVETGATFRAGRPQQLVDLPLPLSLTGAPARYSVSPDGQRFLVLTTADEAKTDQAPSFYQVIVNWPTLLAEQRAKR